MKKRYQNRMRVFLLSISGILVFALTGAFWGNKQKYYTEADFENMEKIDIHCHVNTERPAFMEQAVDDNFRILTINTDAPIGVTIQEQEDIALYQIQKFPDHLAYITLFT
jgi:hypothetical protein